ncbi:MAG: acetyl-CoA carboxylase biotin carboxyl carrier protein [Cyanobacteria bacterium P01_A01_bin.123]
MNLSFSELRDLVAALNQTDVAELTLKSGDFELTLRKQSTATPLVVSETHTLSSQPAGPLPTSLPTSTPATPAVSTPFPSPVPPPSADPNLLEITSPMVGTFYRSPGPDEPPFVDVGDRIQNGQTVCIIEAMKLMNELEAEIAGEIVEILVENSDPVEFGQTLMRVKPV